MDPGKSDYDEGNELYLYGCYSKSLPYFLKAAEWEYPPAYLRLMQFYRLNTGIFESKRELNKWIQKASKCVEWFKKALCEDDPDGDAHHNMALIYDCGIGIETDEAEATRLYDVAAEKKHPEALCMQNDLEYYVYAAKKWYAPAQFYLALYYISRQDIERGSGWLHNSASQGFTVAQNELAFRYENGLDMEQNDEKSVYWSKAASDQGHTESTYRLSTHYDLGTGIEQDKDRALILCEQAAKEGLAIAQFSLGLQSEDVRWIITAAKQGHSQAQCHLGTCYRNGDGLSQDYNEAFYWYKQAAKQDHPSAQCFLGLAYKDGEGTCQNYFPAVRWLKASVEQGHEYATLQLGICYSMGLGVNRDSNKAKMYFQSVVDNGCCFQNEAKSELDKLLTHRQIRVHKGTIHHIARPTKESVHVSQPTFCESHCSIF